MKPYCVKVLCWKTRSVTRTKWTFWYFKKSCVLVVDAWVQQLLRHCVECSYPMNETWVSFIPLLLSHLPTNVLPGRWQVRLKLWDACHPCGRPSFSAACFWLLWTFAKWTSKWECRLFTKKRKKKFTLRIMEGKKEPHLCPWWMTHDFTRKWLCTCPRISSVFIPHTCLSVPPVPCLQPPFLPPWQLMEIFLWCTKSTHISLFRGELIGLVRFRLQLSYYTGSEGQQPVTL